MRCAWSPACFITHAHVMSVTWFSCGALHLTPQILVTPLFEFIFVAVQVHPDNTHQLVHPNDVFF